MRDLLLTGEVRGLKPGASVEEVVAALGEPTERSVSAPLILKYGSLEVTIHDRRVVLIAFYLQGDYSRGAVGGALPLGRTAIEAWLAGSGVDFEHDAALTFGDQSALEVASSGAVAVFELGHLRSVQVTA